MSETNNGHRKILFATVPADGHFNPLTGLAKHLQAAGRDVRWYTQDFYKAKLERLNIPFYPYVKAPQLNQVNFESYFTDRVKQKSQPAKFRFDLEHCFIRPAAECILDVEEIYSGFPFDILIADIFLFSIPLIKAKFNVPVIAVGVVPLMQTSRDLAPSGLGLAPAKGLFGKLKHALLHRITDRLIFRKPTASYRELLAKHGVHVAGQTTFDIIYNSADVVLQSGTPGFEYDRTDLSENIVYAGPMLPHTTVTGNAPWFDERLNKYNRIVLVTQGTVEKDCTKLLVPTLDAFKGTDTLVVCTTGGNGTELLRASFPHSNLIIEDFIPFGDIMPYASVYITNGGYGGVMLGIRNGLPMIVAGVHEGKNEICARVGYFGYGINLKTERPSSYHVSRAVERVTGNSMYKFNVENLRTEFIPYDANKICEQYVTKLTSGKKRGVLSDRIGIDRVEPTIAGS